MGKFFENIDKKLGFGCMRLPLSENGEVDSIDLAFAAEGSESLRNRVENRNGLHTLEHAEEIGLGSRTYNLANIND